ncbi:MAG: Sir2 family NAD-dependent protein deacetylase [Patescibacteria group bacterium]
MTHRDFTRDCLDALRILLEALRPDQHLFVLTGAGISKESGVPTFAETGRNWRGHQTNDLLTPETFARTPELVWEWHREVRQTLHACKPNAAHLLLAKFAKEHDNMTLATQNVDGLHERAGHERVMRLHGSVWRNRCIACDNEREDLSFDFAVPSCPVCGGLERPAVVFYHESVPKDVLNPALQCALSAKIVLVIGTAGTVRPAADIPRLARMCGAIVADVNPCDNAVPATFRIRMPATKALTELFA